MSDGEQKSASHDSISQIARFLAENGCVTDLPDTLGNRPIHYACQMGDWITVRCLVLDFKVDLFKPNSNGKIPVDYATSEEIREFLTAEMCQKTTAVKPSNFNPSEALSSMQIEPLQRIQGYLLKAFEDASAILSQELKKEHVYESLQSNFEYEMPPNLTASASDALELKVNRLKDELHVASMESSESIQERDQKIKNLETQLETLQNSYNVLDGQFKSTCMELSMKMNQISEIESQYNIVKESLVKSMDSGATLSTQLKDMERSRSQQVTSLQTRIQELENLARRKDEVIRHMGETNRVIDSPKLVNNQTESSKLNQLALHSDILKANWEAVVEDIRVLKSTDSDRNDEEIGRLEKEQAALEQQLNQVLKERKSFIESPESTPTRSSRGFMYLEDLLGQLQVNSVEVSPPYTPNGSPARDSDDGKLLHRMSYRMSTVINHEECDLDPTLLNRLMDAAKRKIQRLKRRCETIEEEAMDLRNQVEEKEIHIKDTYGLLQASNKRAAEAESKLSRRGADHDKFNRKLREIENERKLELNLLQKIIEEFIGPSSNDDNEVEILQGILGMIHTLFLELDPVLLGSLPSNLVNPTTDDMIQLPDFSENSAIDAHKYNSHLLQALTDVAARIKEYLNHLSSALGSMKTENKKFVKEIMKLKKEAVVKSLVANVRDSIDPKRLGRLDFSENEIKKHLQKKVDPFAPGTLIPSFPSTPARPVRVNRQSSVTAISEASVAYSVSGMTSEASDIMESLKRLKLEISHLQAIETPSVEAKARVTELKQEYRGFVKRLMKVLQTESPSEAATSTSQELKERLKQVSLTNKKLTER